MIALAPNFVAIDCSVCELQWFLVHIQLLIDLSISQRMASYGFLL